MSEQSRGDKLKAARIAKGLSLEDVQKKTKIHPKVLEALEQDSTLGLDPVYLRGFLKIYCQHLGLDPREFVTGLKDNPRDYLPKSKDAIAKPALKVSLPKPDIRIIKNIIIVLIAAAVLFFLFKASRNWHFAPKPAKEKKQAAPVAVKPAVKHESAPVVSSEPRLSIHAKESSLLKVKVDGKTVFEGTLKKGQSANWRAKEKIELNIGNASGLDLEVNGKTISPLGKKSRSVKRAVVTKEGFEVLK